MKTTQPMHTLRRFAITGASCAGCVRKIESGLASQPDVESASLNFANRTLSVMSTLEGEQIATLVSALGYGAKEVTDTSLFDLAESQQLAASKERAVLLKRTLAGLIPGIAMMLFGMTFGMQVTNASQQIYWGLLGVIAAIAMAYSGRAIFITGWRSAVHSAPSMDTLVTLGTAAAWLYSFVVVLFYPYFPTQTQHVYFEAGTMILGFVNLGRLLEHNARQKTGEAISELLDRQAKTAWLIQEGGDLACPIEAINIGKRIRVKPGETIPLDGEVENGHGLIDESMLSGEPLPVEKGPGDKVFAGCINGATAFTLIVTARSDDSTLAGIIRSVQQAQSAKPPIGRLADTISAVFVPAVIVLALIVASIWWHADTTASGSLALVAGVSVLIIACPCALGLATPMSVMVGVGRAAQSGILIRNGDALQNAALIDTLVIDKTGTLTMGAPSVSRVDMSEGVEQQTLLTLVRSLESHSEHALAAALIEYCKNMGGASSADVTRINIKSGLGLTGVVNQHHVTIGSERYMASEGVSVPAHTIDDGLSAVYVAIDNMYAARFFFHDPIRQDSAAAIQQLQKQGIECIIVSGDSETSVANVAKYLNIKSFHARSLPEDKKAYVESLQSLGKKVAMAGDGINDAPALALADVSFAMGSGTAIALSAADIALMRNSISGVADAIAVSKATIRNIKQNLFWAFAYNVVSIPIAAGVLYPFTGELLNPMIAGAAMALSSVTVASNANRLRWISLKI